MAKYSSKDLQGFAQAAHSLKLYRRADLRDDDNDRNLIDRLYVDPLQGNAVLETMLRDSTTFLIGRKGTGKSTVFQRTQHELRSKTNVISAYIDIKTVFEAADVDQSLQTKLMQSGATLSDESLRRVLLYRAFIKAVFHDIKIELKGQLASSVFERILIKLGFKKSDVAESIDELLEGAFESQLIDVAALRPVKAKTSQRKINTGKSKANVGAKAKAGLQGILGSVTANYSRTSGFTQQDAKSEEYSGILLRTFDINKIIEDLQSILNGIGIRKLFLFVDDFSELPYEAMCIFVDTVLAPLNNWSNELIKFKIAAYPGRIYLGKIDPTKIDEIHLDLYKLYGDRDVTTMEEKAADFTKRLVDSRFKHYLNKEFADFVDGDADQVFKQLFYASMANPRTLGHLLANLRDSVTAYHKPIGVRAIQDAARKYYEDKIEPFFGIQKFSHESFSERSSLFSLKELLESIVSRARDLRDYKGSRVTQSTSGRTPSSHFYILDPLEATLSTLELNFFLTLYYVMKDRDGNKVSVYALNYGLCGKHNINFGRPSATREHRLYFVERIFDYTSILHRFLESNQEIKCDDCGTVFGLDKLESLAMFDMLCPECRRGTCQVTNLSKKYEGVIRSVSPSLLLPPTELGILEALYTEGHQMVASEIAGELDCSYQLVGKRGKILADRGLVTRDKNDANRRVFSITSKATKDYFTANPERQLDVKHK